MTDTQPHLKVPLSVSHTILSGRIENMRGTMMMFDWLYSFREQTNQIIELTNQLKKENEILRKENEALRSIDHEKIAEIVTKSIRLYE